MALLTIEGLGLRVKHFENYHMTRYSFCVELLKYGSYVFVGPIAFSESEQAFVKMIIM